VSVCPSHLSAAAAAGDGFAVVRPLAGDIDRQLQAHSAATAPQHGAQQKKNSKCGQCHVDS